MHLVVLVLVGFLAVSDAFFLFAKHERWLFCFKICPVYCSPRRYDEDVASSVYIEDELPYHSYPPYEDHPHFSSYPHPYHPRFVICKPETTTTPKPTTTTMPTTTPEPTYICMLCMRKCNDLDRK